MNRLLTMMITGMLVGRLASSLPAEESIDYSRHIRPLLSNSCYACHGPDRSNQQNEVRLDLRELAIESAIIPGDAESSELIRRLSSDDPDERMPPADSKKPQLNADQIALIRRWIDQGADFTSHWSYARLERPTVPEVEASDWPLNPIDHFVLAQNRERSVSQAEDADPRTLVRRLYFDLLGLPPTPDQVARYQENDSLDTYDRIVDELLASEHFGERMAVFWLDLVRFADTCGYHGDQQREIAAYRNFVIEAFNSSLPFDEFTIVQIAGDLLPEATDRDRIGSGYNRLLQTTEEGGAQAMEYRAIYAADRVRNAATVWLGSTLGCAQCHDHKFDPFSTEDFYRFAAFFADVEEVAVGRQNPNLRLPTAEQSQQLEELDRQIAKLKQAAATAEAEAKKQDSQGDGASAKEANGASLDAINNELKQAEESRKRIDAQIPRTLVTRSVERRMTRILPRGNWLDESGPEVQPGVPAVFAAADTQGTANRLDLARWIVARDNPLTARVFANHLWRLMFGEGLVRTPDDFGSQGDYPTHPKLLDWLGCELIDSGWNTKHILKLIVTSRTYRQSSEWNAELQRRDVDNQWLARQNRFRLEAEMIRDNALAVSGLLVRQAGGRSVKPYQPAGYWAQLNFPKRQYQADQGDDQYRRGVYTYWCRTFLHPSLAAFDAPTREECTAQRTRSNTPLQALVLLNDPTYIEAATQFAKRIIDEGGDRPDQQISWAFREVLARGATDRETELLTQVFNRQLERYRQDAESARQVAKTIRAESKQNVAELAAWTAVTRVLLNLHETITRY